MNPKGLWYGDHIPGFITLEKTIIAKETRSEIERLFSDPEKEMKARQGRLMCAKYMSWPSYEELCLSSVPDYKISDFNNLGPDSFVDKKIISLAYNYAMNDKDGFVFVLTWDGGIQTELSLLRGQFKLPIFSPVCINDFLKFIGGTKVIDNSPQNLL